MKEASVSIPVSFRARVRPSPDVLAREVGGESVILDMKKQRYLGLDPVGTRMWALLTASDSIEAAYAALLEEFEVAPEVLRRDLVELVGRLSSEGLIQIQS
jgi:hypothetical protein